jgi:hypothetical protein
MLAQLLGYLFGWVLPVCIIIGLSGHVTQVGGHQVLPPWPGTCTRDCCRSCDFDLQVTVFVLHCGTGSSWSCDLGLAGQTVRRAGHVT